MTMVNTAARNGRGDLNGNRVLGASNDGTVYSGSNNVEMEKESIRT